MVPLLWVLGIFLWAINVLHVSAWIVFLWPLTIMAALLVFMLVGGGALFAGALGFVGLSSLFENRRRNKVLKNRRPF